MVALSSSSSSPSLLGYRFVPKDYELIIILKSKIRNIPTNPIQVVDLYSHDPMTITEMYPPLGDSEWYFFTARKRKYLNGSRPDRTAGDGYWKKVTGDKKVYHHGRVIGTKTALVFNVGKHMNSVKTDWIMHEYRLHHQSKAEDNMNFEELVLCRIHENGRQPIDDNQAFIDDQELVAPTINTHHDQEQNHLPANDQELPEDQQPSTDTVTHHQDFPAGVMDFGVPNREPSVNSTHQDHYQQLIAPTMNANPSIITTHQDQEHYHLPANDQELTVCDQTDISFEEFFELMKWELPEDHKPSTDTDHHQEFPVVMDFGIPDHEPSINSTHQDHDQHLTANQSDCNQTDIMMPFDREFPAVMDFGTPNQERFLYQDPDAHQQQQQWIQRPNLYEQQQQKIHEQQQQQWIQRPNFHEQQQQKFHEQQQQQWIQRPNFHEQQQQKIHEQQQQWIQLPNFHEQQQQKFHEQQQQLIVRSF